MEYILILGSKKPTDPNHWSKLPGRSWIYVHLPLLAAPCILRGATPISEVWLFVTPISHPQVMIIFSRENPMGLLGTKPTILGNNHIPKSPWQYPAKCLLIHPIQESYRWCFSWSERLVEVCYFGRQKLPCKLVATLQNAPPPKKISRTC